MERDNSFDRLVKPRFLGYLSETCADYRFDIALDSGCGYHRRGEHLAVDAVLDMRNRGVAPCHFGGELGISGIYVAEVVAANLRADPLTVGILVDRRLGRIVAVGNP